MGSVNYTNGSWVTACTVCRWGWSDVDRYAANIERVDHEIDRGHLTIAPNWEPAA